MSLKDKIKSFLFPSAAKETEDPIAEELYIPEEAAVPEEDGAADETKLELSPDHPLNRLYNRRRQEVNRYLPSPRLCLDEDGVLPMELVEKEKKRLKTVLTSVCKARLKEVNNRNKQKTDSKGKDGEKEGKKKEAAELPPLDALPYFFLSADKLYAWVIVFPPVGPGEEITREMLYEALVDKEIDYGVDTQMMDHVCRDERRYFNLFLIARGKPAFDGKNGNIVDNFPRVIERVLEVDEFGQVDYTALNQIRNVKQGQEICHLIRPTEGEPGRTVLDQEIPAKSGKSVPLPAGRNTEISEDGISLLASISGHVEFTGRSFHVKPVMDIPGNVDFSTGSITFFGDVNVHGDVLSGFTVQAMGNIHVDGVVEAGSTVEAGGDLVVVKGILGDGTTTIRAHRCVFSKYIENATIHVQENLQTDCIMNSKVYCDGEVQVRSGRGSIIGGRVWAAKKISATAVGAQSECKTSVILGGLPCTSFERESVQRELKELEMELEKLECQLDSPVKSSLLGKLRIKMSAADMKMRQLEEDLMNIKMDLEEKGGGRLECGIAYAGTEISFGSETLRLRRAERQCVAKMVCGEILLM